jgi:hypothetical protein
LQNPDEALSRKYLKKYQKALTYDEIVSVVGLDDLKAENVTVKNEANFWHYKAEDVPDFAFCASDDYLWDLTSFVVDKNTGRRATVSAAYHDEAKHFYKAVEIGKKTVDYLSNELPGVPYPFPSMTIFQGTSAMEYPMMVNIRAYRANWEWLYISTLIQEIVHSYFPFYMGTNERKYAFMDEGWARMIVLKIQTEEI